jgi:hypothetical protein
MHPPAGTCGKLSAMKLDAFARHSPTFGPSPAHRLERLTAHLGGQAALSAYAGVVT